MGHSGLEVATVSLCFSMISCFLAICQANEHVPIPLQHRSLLLTMIKLEIHHCGLVDKCFVNATVPCLHCGEFNVDVKSLVTFCAIFGLHDAQCKWWEFSCHMNIILS